MRSRPWLPRVRHLLGKLPDAELARRVGVTRLTILNVRRELGIEARAGRDLDAVGPEGTVRLVRARARAGGGMRVGDVNNVRLIGLCNRFFGGWYQAVEAAGLKPEGKPRRGTKPGGRKRPLTPALLAGPKSALELERLTGIPRRTIRRRRQKLGIVRDEKSPDRSWVKGVRSLLGKVPDKEVARRSGRPTWAVTEARRRVGIVAAPRASAARDLRLRIHGASKAALWRALAQLDAKSRAIFEARVLQERPVSLGDLGRRLGMTKQGVAYRERRAIQAVMAAIAVPGARG